MSLIDNYHRNVPEYYPEMARDGFTPAQIMYAFRKKMYAEFLDNPKKEQVNEVVVKSEIKMK